MKNVEVKRKKDGSVVPYEGMSLFVGSAAELLDRCRAHLRKPGGNLWTIVTPNPEQVRLSWHDPLFAQALRQATLAIPDGAGIIWSLSRRGVQAVRIPGRMLMEQLLNEACAQQYPVLLIGGKPGAGERVAQRYGSPAFMHVHPGAVDIRHETSQERATVLALLATVRPALVLVAYGAPYQERWVQTLRPELEAAGVAIAMVVGGGIDYLAGSAASVPAWVERLNGEWLFRLLHEPWRWKRQLIGLEFFVRELFR